MNPGFAGYVFQAPLNYQSKEIDKGFTTRAIAPSVISSLKATDQLENAREYQRLSPATWQPCDRKHS
ncbi:hypothetical protein [Aporhodopirellula aestuarii]|uniref:Uncharacterized protein n=1 Tax=Aporhodopirellula aestuarii TaxID=2950107 RepID=A0ABT0U7I1_9BACT|nr:hypothetical protein [Aporhodopirellula aestuarii]MCM2372639.1 hypothetical protein [Aporhodopirellula aestuarii]